MVDITKCLIISDDADKEEEDDRPTVDQIDFSTIDGGVYQAGRLLDIFKKILQRMNNSNDKKGVSAPTPGDKPTPPKVTFPYNELYKTSPFRYLYDWESLVKYEEE
jgi:hypothetical protein